MSRRMHKPAVRLGYVRPWYCPICHRRYAEQYVSFVADDGVVLVFCPVCGLSIGALSVRRISL